jgi:hypothetical protein
MRGKSPFTASSFSARYCGARHIARACDQVTLAASAPPPELLARLREHKAEIRVVGQFESP